MKKQQIKLRPAVIATLLGIGICLFFIVCGNLNYETNDDELLNLIAAGAWGFKSSQYLVYQNIVLGYVFKMLYTVLPCLNNYAIFFIICNVVCVVLLAYRFGKTHSTAVSILFVTGLCILLKADFFETIQYTKNAFLYAAVGWIYLLSQNSDHKISDSVIGIVLLSISFMTRKESMLFSTPFVIAWLIGHRSIIRDHRTIFIKRGCILLIVIVGLFLINKLSLRSPEWNAYIRYNDVRTELLDYGIPSYEENSQFYDSTGISENDLDVMSQWNYGDNQVYDYETMHSIADLKHRPLFSISSLITSMEDLYTVAHSSALPAIWFLLIAAIVFLHNKEGAIFMVLSSLVIFVEYVFLNNNLRVIWRVEIGIWLIPILLALFELNGERETDSSLSIPSLIASLLALSVIASQLVFNFAFRKHFSISLKNEDNRYDEIM